MVLWIPLASATCGLDVCPAPPRGPSWQVALDTEVGGHGVDDLRGTWSRSLLGIRASGRRLQGSVSLPYMAQWVEGRSDHGVGNLLLSGQWDDLSARLHPIAGAQLELPVGDVSVAHLHTATLGWLGVRVAESWTVDLRVGVRWEVGGMSREPVALSAPASSAREVGIDHTEIETVLSPSGEVVRTVKLVDPHDPAELVARGVLGPNLGSVTPGITADLAVGDDVSLDAGAMLRAWLGGRVQAAISARAPVTTDRRFGWRSGVGMTVTL